MILDRREFLRATTCGVTLAGLWRPAPRAQGKSAIKAVAFDAFPIFDPQTIVHVAESLFPGKGVELGNTWRTRQFEYQWLRALSRSYADFWQTTEDSLVFACAALNLELSADARAQLMNAYITLKSWPDVPASLARLTKAGIRIALLSNMTKWMLEANIKSAGLEGNFDHVLSSDQIRSYKPSAQAYQLGVDALKLRREEILFAAFAGWDAAGAKQFGYPTFWINRLHAQTEQLGVFPDQTSQDLGQLVDFATQTQ
jgi:2-haloacid dehalogenase